MIEVAIPRVRPLDEPAMAAARAMLDRLTKPPGSLGRLEELAVVLAGMRGEPAPRVDRPAIVIAAADHGVTAQGVSPYPSAVTAQMVANFLAGGAAINVLADSVDASLTVLDLGIAWRHEGRPTEGGVLLSRPIRAGTDDISRGPAMTRDEAIRAIEAGSRTFDEVHAAGADLLGVGEMGIGNTTAASALVAALTGQPVEAVTGRGTGLDEAGRRRKVAVIERALEVNRIDPCDPVGALAAVGGLEIAALVGLLLAGAAARVPVVLDGFITGAAALVAARLEPAITSRLIASHRSAEPGHAVVLESLGLRPLLELDLRLGEGTGAALAIGLVRAACRLRDEMATFESAGVAGRTDRP